MIPKEIKQRLLKELEKSGNIGSACVKAGINRSTYHRWRNASKTFRDDSNKAIRLGRENISDISEYSLMMNVKKGNMAAIKYALSHNSQRYKPKIRKVIIEHSTAEKDNDEIFRKQYKQAFDELTLGYKEIVEDLRKIEKKDDKNNLINFSKDETDE